MALSPAEITKVFKIFGIPQSGNAVLGRDALLSRYPGVITFTVANNVATLTAILAALTAEQIVEMQTMITAWESIGDVSTLTISGDLDTRGSIVNRKEERENIRRTISNIIGFVTGSPGFYDEAKQKFGDNCNGGRLIR